MNLLPESVYYQYISHLYHGGNLIAWDDYKPDPNWTYPDHDSSRFTRILINNRHLIDKQRILDLGCHSGFMLYVAHHLGANQLSGVNARLKPIEVGKYFFTQFDLDVNFYHDDIENFDLLKKLCDDHDTVIMASVLEHLRNPEHILSIISQSHVQNIIFEGTMVQDDNLLPKIYYRIEDTEWDFAAYNRAQNKAIASIPNRKFLETMLFYHKWKITDINVLPEFDCNLFATENLSSPPAYRSSMVLVAERF